MKIKKFIANDFKVAMKQAKAEMGNDAIILQTRQIRTGGFFGLFTKPKVEITVAVDETMQVNLDKLRKTATNQIEEKQAEHRLSQKTQSGNPYLSGDLLEELNTLKTMMTDIKLQMHEVELIKGISEELRDFYHALVGNKIKQDIALHIVSTVEDKFSNYELIDTLLAEETIIATIQEYINEIRPIEIKNDKKGNVIFFVGPTGVGKTTTIAKLAANIAFIDHKDVALVTLDTFRISAAEQLRTFAEIINIPISVVFDPDELVKVIVEYSDKDVILVDTAGCSPYNAGHLAELKRFVDASNPNEIMLVLSAITDSSDLINIYNKFNLFEIDKIIFTKLDEANNYGQILNALYEIKKPIAYLTTGQNVPDDIQIPDSLDLAKKLLGCEQIS